MKKLEKRFNKKRNTVEAYYIPCGCICMCNYCAAYYESQFEADAIRLARSARDV